MKIEGLPKLYKSMKKLGDVPQKHVTSSVKKSMNPILKQAKSDAPDLTGNLKKGMKLVGEKAKPKGRKVYRLVFDRAMNEIFQKKDRSGEVAGYYPVSQEYGYFTRDGRYIEGKKFIRNAFNQNVQKVEESIIKNMQEKIDAEIAKGGLKK